MIAALLMLAQITPVPAEPRPIVTTIAAIRRDPKKFNGHLVRIHGYVNACRPLDCSIEERAATSPQGPGLRLSIAGDAKFDSTVKPLIPTYVEFDARFDATCLLRSAPNVITVCGDRDPELTIVTLRSIVSPEPPRFENP